MSNYKNIVIKDLEARRDRLCNNFLIRLLGSGALVALAVSLPRSEVTLLLLGSGVTLFVQAFLYAFNHQGQLNRLIYKIDQIKKGE